MTSITVNEASMSAVDFPTQILIPGKYLLFNVTYLLYPSIVASSELFCMIMPFIKPILSTELLL